MSVWPFTYVQMFYITDDKKWLLPLPNTIAIDITTAIAITIIVIMITIRLWNGRMPRQAALTEKYVFRDITGPYRYSWRKCISYIEYIQSNLSPIHSPFEMEIYVYTQPLFAPYSQCRKKRYKYDLTRSLFLPPFGLFVFLSTWHALCPMSQMSHLTRIKMIMVPASEADRVPSFDRIQDTQSPVSMSFNIQGT